MRNLFYTIMVIPNRKGRSLHLQLDRRTLFFALLGALFFCSLLSALVIHYVYILDREFEARMLRKQNASLKMQLKSVEKKVEAVENRLVSLAQLDEKLRALTALADHERGLAMGPMPPSLPEQNGFHNLIDPFEGAAQDLQVGSVQDAILNSRIQGLAEDAERQLISLSSLVDYFSEQKTLLASTPSIWPSVGWVSSNFGQRMDPYTGNQAMHVGVDIASREGTKVIAPAAGRVLFVGEGGAYGNLLSIDHGRGLVTYYGHLQKSLVKIGDRVTRGDEIALVGNSGRSTGPHLHYEVRQDGLPVNPRRYIIY